MYVIQLTLFGLFSIYFCTCAIISKSSFNVVAGNPFKLTDVNVGITPRELRVYNNEKKKKQKE
jgi:hypothetical protein